MSHQVEILVTSAKELGKYILQAEFDLVVDEFSKAEIESFEHFKSWITGYMYYNALVCTCSGNMQDVDTQLEVDYDELMQD